MNDFCIQIKIICGSIKYLPWCQKIQWIWKKGKCSYKSSFEHEGPYILQMIIFLLLFQNMNKNAKNAVKLFSWAIWFQKYKWIFLFCQSKENRCKGFFVHVILCRCFCGDHFHDILLEYKKASFTNYGLVIFYKMIV